MNRKEQQIGRRAFIFGAAALSLEACTRPTQPPKERNSLQTDLEIVRNEIATRGLQESPTEKALWRTQQSPLDQYTLSIRRMQASENSPLKNTGELLSAMQKAGLLLPIPDPRIQDPINFGLQPGLLQKDDQSPKIFTYALQTNPNFNSRPQGIDAALELAVISKYIEYFERETTSLSPEKKNEIISSLYAKPDKRLEILSQAYANLAESAIQSLGLGVQISDANTRDAAAFIKANKDVNNPLWRDYIRRNKM